MAEYIEREALINHVEDLPTWGEDGKLLDREDVISSIGNRYAADVAPVRHGRWNRAYKSGVKVAVGVVSSCCDMWNERRSHYCPNCGAKMDGGNYEQKY